MILPNALLLLVAAQLDAAFAQQAALPTAIRKMAPDPGEKFFPEYVAFRDDSIASDSRPGAGAALHPAIRPAVAARALAQADDGASSLNTSLTTELLPPLALHLNHRPDQQALDESLRRRWDLFRRASDALGRLQSRQNFQCPSDTNNCLVIGYPNSCCGKTQQCIQIPDTGLGKVGCCPAGQNCVGSVAACPVGDTPCPVTMGGGCCIPGFVCQGLGCVPSASATGPAIVASTSTTTITTGAAPLVVVTVVITETSGATTSTLTQVVTGSSNITSTGTTVSPPATTSSTTDTGLVIAPRPTQVTNTPSTTTPSSSNAFCPTGFYACVASAGGGCCQTDRQCHTTSCPPPPFTTIISSGETVAVPVTNIPASTSPRCAGGWYLCGTDAGPIAGCCPTGYACGTASCGLTASLQAAPTVAKELPNDGHKDPGTDKSKLLWALAACLATWMFI